MIKNILSIITLFFLLSGCLKNEASVNPCIYDECALKAPVNEIQDVQAYLTANNITNATQHCSGCFIVWLRLVRGKRQTFAVQFPLSIPGVLQMETYLIKLRPRLQAFL